MASNTAESVIRKQNEVKPQPGGQTIVMQDVHTFEMLFGGSAGPGKSWVLVIDALGLQMEQLPDFGMRAIDHPDYRAVLFRRETTQLAKLLDEAKKYYPAFGAVFRAKGTGAPGPGFEFPSGARIYFCHMQQEKHKEVHQGQEYSYVGFDELTHFTYTQYLYLFIRSRSVINGLPGRIRSTTNPTGSGLRWVKRRFITNMEYYKQYHFIADEDNDDNYRGIEVDPSHKDALSRKFIPGKLTDNKILMESDPHYRRRIKMMGPKMASALLDGNWDAFTGDFFDDFDYNLGVKPFAIPETWRLIGSLDPGWSSPASFGLTAVNPEGELVRLFTYYVKGKSPQEHAKEIKRRLKGFRWTRGRMPDLIVSGRDAWAKKEQFAILANERTVADVFQEFDLMLEPATTDRIPGWWAVKDLLRAKQWKYFLDYNEPLIEEIIAAEHDEKDPEDIAGKGNDPNVFDHALDEWRYGIVAADIPPKSQYDDNLPDWAKKAFGLTEDNNEDFSVMGL